MSGYYAYVILGEELVGGIVIDTWIEAVFVNREHAHFHENRLNRDAPPFIRYKTRAREITFDLSKGGD